MAIEVFRHGWPANQWAELKKKKIPLSIPIQSDEWTEAANNMLPDLTLGHYLAARFVIYSLMIPPRVKDCVVDSAPETVRRRLNDWNRDIGHLGNNYGFGSIRGSIRVREPMMAIAESAAGEYLPIRNKEKEIEKLALAIFDMAVSFNLINETEIMCS